MLCRMEMHITTRHCRVASEHLGKLGNLLGRHGGSWEKVPQLKNDQVGIEAVGLDQEDLLDDGRECETARVTGTRFSSIGREWCGKN